MDPCPSVFSFSNLSTIAHDLFFPYQSRVLQVQVLCFSHGKESHYLQCCLVRGIDELWSENQASPI